MIQLLSRTETAAYLSVSIRKVDMLAANGDLPRVKVGRATKFELADVQRFVMSHKQSPEPGVLRQLDRDRVDPDAAQDSLDEALASFLLPSLVRAAHSAPPGTNTEYNAATDNSKLPGDGSNQD